MLDELKTAWVGALRSGEYTQGRDFLEKDGKFCCLGVLCDVLRPDKCREFRDPFKEVIHQNVLETIGMSSHVQNDLAEMNDEGDSFEQIADWIASHDLQSGAEQC